MIKQEVPVITISNIGTLISMAINIQEMDYYLDSSNLWHEIKITVRNSIPYNNSDVFNVIPNKDLQTANIITRQMHKMIKELKCLH